MSEFVSLSAAGIMEEHFKSDAGLKALSVPEERVDKELREKLYEATISVAKFADVTTIPNDKVYNRIRNDSFEYYRADLGMNILVPRRKIKSLRFKLTFLGITAVMFMLLVDFQTM